MAEFTAAIASEEIVSIRRIVLDVDVGIDDALMMLDVAGHSLVEIVAVAGTHGIRDERQAALNALRVLEGRGLDEVPVAVGGPSPLPNPTTAPRVHGHDGLADAGLPEPRHGVSGEHAGEQLLRLGYERPGEFDLLLVGAITNPALRAGSTRSSPGSADAESGSDRPG